MYILLLFQFYQYNPPAVAKWSKQWQNQQRGKIVMNEMKYVCLANEKR